MLSGSPKPWKQVESNKTRCSNTGKLLRPKASLGKPRDFSNFTSIFSRKTLKLCAPREAAQRDSAEERSEADREEWVVADPTLCTCDRVQEGRRRS